jgi:hypothetical protein
MSVLTMRAEILDRAVAFEVQPEALPDGTAAPPARVTLTLRLCWRKPPIRLLLSYVYTEDKVAYYVEKP